MCVVFKVALFILVCWHFTEYSICVCLAVMGEGRGREIRTPRLLIQKREEIEGEGMGSEGRGRVRIYS